MSVRFFLIYASLLSVFLTICLFLLSPLFGLGLDHEKGEHLQVIQIIIPTFLGYLTAAVTYATSKASFREPRGEKGRILQIVTVGSVLVFFFGVLLATVVFGLSSQEGSTLPGVSFSQYSSIVSILLGILSATTSAVSAFIFSSGTSKVAEETGGTR